MGKVFVGLALLALLGSSSGCGFQADWEARALGLAQDLPGALPPQTPPASTGNSPGKSAFIDNVLPLLRARCSACHVASLQNPYLADSDPNVAYEAATHPPLVDFNEPAESSLLIVRASDGHCGTANCYSPDPAEALALITAVEVWSAEERSGP